MPSLSANQQKRRRHSPQWPEFGLPVLWLTVTLNSFRETKKRFFPALPDVSGLSDKSLQSRSGHRLGFRTMIKMYESWNLDHFKAPKLFIAHNFWMHQLPAFCSTEKLCPTSIKDQTLHAHTHDQLCVTLGRWNCLNLICLSEEVLPSPLLHLGVVWFCYCIHLQAVKSEDDVNILKDCLWLNRKEIKMQSIFYRNGNSLTQKKARHTHVFVYEFNYIAYAFWGTH